MNENELGDLLIKLRGNHSLREIGELTGLSHTYISDVEKGYRRGSKKQLKPSPDTLKRLASAYNYPYEELMKIAGYLETETTTDYISEDKSTNGSQLTEKDERDIGKRMAKIKKDLIEGSSDDNQAALSFMGEPMSEEAIESLLEALEHAERLATLANKKYIPKKYRKD
ncbi:helix-turn-helix domain-containing protein [Lysinibacillus sp. NPDC092081]|uniref:helix-turn-helix domain-containing protein n=1 Tax=Lysinibacillus sp. NPDC092081 TaxID=3364131 RepID=UPI0037FA3BAD